MRHPTHPTEADVRHALSWTYKPEGVDIWLRARNRMLNGERPEDLIARGEAPRVYWLAVALSEGVAT